MNYSAKPDIWPSIPDLFRQSDAPLPSPWDALFEPLRRGRIDDMVVVGQLGQSIDGRIATANGHSKYINGPAGLDHLHRLRALVDAVIVGVGTAVTDDPQLTVRRVAGPNPARVVVDPRGRLSASARMLAADGIRRIAVVGKDVAHDVAPGIDVLRIDLDAGHAAPAAILAGLAERGLKRILVEGGAQTVSGFLNAGCLDRLHVVVAPMLLGTGRASLMLPPVERADRALRPPVRAHIIDDEVLFDVDLSDHRRPVGRANTSR
jgi:diaminohydroxyphosphoribosylaminopyrimidine deaminase / 5-amino-6-(5-phosphoribosylamino)uracil reductase